MKNFFNIMKKAHKRTDIAPLEQAFAVIANDKEGRNSQLKKLKKIFLQYPELNINAVDFQGFSMLHIAVIHSKPYIVDLLLKLKANPDLPIKNPSEEHIFSPTAYYNPIHFLPLSSPDINPETQATIASLEGATPLHLACINYITTNDQKLTIERLLTYGANPNAQTKSGETPMDMVMKLADRVRSDILATDNIMIKLLPSIELLYEKEGLPNKQIRSLLSSEFEKTLLRGATETLNITSFFKKSLDITLIRVPTLRKGHRNWETALRSPAPTPKEAQDPALRNLAELIYQLPNEIKAQVAGYLSGPINTIVRHKPDWLKAFTQTMATPTKTRPALAEDTRLVSLLTQEKLRPVEVSRDIIRPPSFSYAAAVRQGVNYDGEPVEKVLQDIRDKKNAITLDKKLTAFEKKRKYEQKGEYTYPRDTISHTRS